MPDTTTGFSWPSLTANGNVRPGRAVVGVTGAGNALKAIEAAVAASLPVLGITGESTRFPPGSASDDGFNAIATESLKNVLSPGMIGRAVAGAAISNASQPLTHDNQGRLVTAAPSAGTTVWCCAYPLTTVSNAGEWVDIVVVPPFPWTAPA